MMTNWGKCARCGKYAFLPHSCKEFECALEQGSEPDFGTVWARDAEEAAEAYAEDYDCYGDYTIIQDGDRGTNVVLVREPDSETPPLRFHVIGETVPEYHAYPLLEGKSP
jgi:hypothetical protein